MKYIGLSLKYVFQNFLRLLPFALIPAVLLAFGMDLVAFTSNVKLMSEGASLPFGTIYASLSLFAGRLWWLKLIALAAFLLLNGVLLTTVDRHMRIGKFSFRFFQRLDDVFARALPVTFIALAIAEFFAFISSCVIVLFALAVPPHAMAYVSVVMLALMGLLWGLVTVLFLNWVPCMLVQGYPFGDAFGVSVRQTAKRLPGILFALLFPFIVTVPLMVVARLFFDRFDVIMYFLCYLFLVMYIPALSMSSYYEIFGYERRDVKYRLFK